MADRLTGKASYLTIGSTLIPITKYTQTADRNLANTTDNGDYNSTSNIISPTQIETTVTTKVSIEGRYRKSSTPATIVTKLYVGNGPYAVVLGLDAGTLSGNGNFDISNYKQDVPVEDTVVFTCDLTSNGPFTPNS